MQSVFKWFCKHKSLWLPQLVIAVVLLVAVIALTSGKQIATFVYRIF